MQAQPPDVEAKPVLERVFREDKPTRLDIEGVVRDDKGVPIAGARITVQELSLSATSDAGGKFSFSGVPIGHYNLRANWKTDKGVKNKSVEINVPAAAGAYDIELKG
jgi:protocatechuate 3,4-dioxygenase beta subunit